MLFIWYIVVHVVLIDLSCKIRPLPTCSKNILTCLALRSNALSISNLAKIRDLKLASIKGDGAQSKTYSFAGIMFDNKPWEKITSGPPNEERRQGE